MKGLVALSVFFFLAGDIATSPVGWSDDISPLPEILTEIDVRDPEHRWALIPDGDGKMHLIDMNPYDVPIEPLFNAVNDVFFVLYTQRTRDNGERLSLDVEAIRNTQFKSGVETRFSMETPVNTQIQSAYLDRGDFNVIVVDWGAGAKTINYATARNNINSVADVTAELIDFLIYNGFTTRAQILIVGHSLGGHTAGITGKKVSGGKIQTIVGLDPAGPLFSINKPDERIDSGDANYVEIMHTNGGTLGFGDPLGDADFYPNFGRSQPGCGIDLVGSCAHGRAPTYFAESITNNQFVAVQCASSDEVNKKRCSVQSEGYKMGGQPPNNGLHGYFYLTTNSKSPFGQG